MSKIIVATGLAALLLSAVTIPVNAADKLVTNGKSLNGVSLNGISLNGVSLNGRSLNGISLNRIALNRLAANGVSLNGKSVNDVTTANGTVDEILSIELSDGTIYTK